LCVGIHHKQKPHEFKSGNKNTTIILNHWLIKETMSSINKSLPWTNYKKKKKVLALTLHNVSHAPENMSDIRHSTNQQMTEGHKWVAKNF
jgi:hypothetical protein